mgnify:CR=1 FL=1
MEGAILLGLAGVGYLMNKETQSHRIETNVKPQVFQNSNSSIYDLNNVKDAQAMEAQMIQDNFQQTLSNGSTMVSDFNAKDKEVVPQSDIVMGLDGNPIDKNNFLVNDQGIKVEPFFSGEGPPSINFNDTRILSQHQGGFQNEFYQNKTEVNLNLPPQMNVGNVFGMSDTGPAVEQDRYIPGMYRTDELPFERERVAHIDQKSEVNRDVGEIFAQRNSVDNIRALSNQKVSFGGKVLAGKGVDHRSVEGQVYKHLPNQDYENTLEGKKTKNRLSRKSKFKSLIIDKDFEPENPKQLEELTDNDCKYPIGHPNEKDFYFCGRTSLKDFSYCKLHLLYSYQSKNKKEEPIDKGEIPEFIEKKIKSA